MNSMHVLTLEPAQCPQPPTEPADDTAQTAYADAVLNALVQLLAVGVKDAK